MANGIETGCGKYFKQINIFCDSPGAELVDMSFHQAVGMFVVTAEHHHFPMIMKQSCQGLKIARSTAFAYQYFHTPLHFVKGLLCGETFMISSYARMDVLFCRRSSKSGCMTVHWFVEFFCCSYFFHHFGILLQHTGKIHHLTQIIDLRLR